MHERRVFLYESRKIRHFNNQSGFTLIEILVAMVILTILVVTFGKYIADSYKLSLANRQSNVAISLAQNSLERIKGTWPSFPSDLDDFVGKGLPQQTAQVQEHNVTYTVEWHWEEAASPSPDTWLNPTKPDITPNRKYLFKVWVTVSWPATQGSNNSVTLVTYMTGR